MRIVTLDEHGRLRSHQGLGGRPLSELDPSAFSHEVPVAGFAVGTGFGGAGYMSCWKTEIRWTGGIPKPSVADRRQT